MAGLEQDQPLRRALDPENAAKIEEYVEKIKGLMALSQEFTVVRSIIVFQLPFPSQTTTFF